MTPEDRILAACYVLAGGAAGVVVSQAAILQLLRLVDDAELRAMVARAKARKARAARACA